MILAVPNKDTRMPDITVGSPKQIAWAESIRMSVTASEVLYWRRRGAENLVYEYLAQPKCRNAVFWIDHRSDYHYIEDDITHYVHSHGYKPVEPTYKDDYYYDVEALFV